MDIERAVRVAFALQAPPPDFEEVVMARVSAAAWRASQVAPRVRRRILAVGALVAVAAAAAILVKEYARSDSPPAMPSLPEATVAAPPPVKVAVPLIGDVSVVSAPAAATAMPAAQPPPTEADVSQLCAAAQAGPAVAPAYTVLVEPLNFQTDDPELASRAQRFYAGAINQLKTVPGLGLVGSEAAMTGGKPADYRVILGIEKNFNTKPGQPAWQSSVSLQLWNGTAFIESRRTWSAARALDASMCPSTQVAQDFNCRLDQAGAASVINLAGNLPRHPTAAQAACNNARQQLFREQIVQQSRADPDSFFAPIRQILERLANTSIPVQRINAWSSLRNGASPEFLQLMVQALRESTDIAFRKEMVTLLAVKYPADPPVRDALAEIAARSPDALIRHVADRPQSGLAVWRDYAISRLSDDQLPAGQRLDAVYWMSEAMVIDKDSVGAEMSDLLTVLQRSNRLRVLADVLADTTQDASDQANELVVRQGSWVMRQIGLVDHPAVPELLIAIFDSAPNETALSALAARRDDARVAGKLESIARTSPDDRVRRFAAGYLSRQLETRPPAAAGN